jgi:hypothetical protein
VRFGLDGAKSTTVWPTIVLSTARLFQRRVRRKSCRDVAPHARHEVADPKITDRRPMSTDSRYQRERNSSIIRLSESGDTVASIARRYHITSCRVRQIIANGRLLEHRRAELERVYGPCPRIEALPDDTPVEVLVLRQANIHGWAVRVMNLRYTSLRIKTLGNLRQATDSQLLREPNIGKQMVAQLRLFSRAQGETLTPQVSARKCDRRRQ